jgi:DNA-directed RNA polymerase specialized sigma24 family protein
MQITTCESVIAFDNTTVLQDYSTACRVVNRFMPHNLRSGFDAEDFVGDALVDIMSTPARFAGYNRELLILVARRRMIDAARSPRSRVTALEVDVIDRNQSDGLQHDGAELRELMIGRATEAGYRTELGLRCDGYTLPEIAKLTGAGLRTVQRFFRGFARANEPAGGTKVDRQRN